MLRVSPPSLSACAANWKNRHPKNACCVRKHQTGGPVQNGPLEVIRFCRRDLVSKYLSGVCVFSAVQWPELFRPSREEALPFANIPRREAWPNLRGVYYKPPPVGAGPWRGLRAHNLHAAAVNWRLLMKTGGRQCPLAWAEQRIIVRPPRLALSRTWSLNFRSSDALGVPPSKRIQQLICSSKATYTLFYFF